MDKLPPLPPLPPIGALPPLPPLSALPPLPPLPVLGASLPLPFEPDAPKEPVLLLTQWYPLSINPVHAGKYELGVEFAGGMDAVLDLYLWDGREWADKLPHEANMWRGVDKGKWIDVRADRKPAHSGWHRMRWPRGEKSAPSFYDVEQGGFWCYADPQGELRRYAAGPKWAAEWWHDGAPD